MLVLPIKKKWLNMILSGEKGDEYREIKPYWTVSIVRWLGFPATLNIRRDKFETI